MPWPRLSIDCFKAKIPDNAVIMISVLKSLLLKFACLVLNSCLVNLIDLLKNYLCHYRFSEFRQVIMLTSLCYFHSCKKDNFHLQIVFLFFYMYFAQYKDCGYSLDYDLLGGS